MSSSAQACHQIDVDELSVTESILDGCAFGGKTEFLVEPDRRFVIRIHVEFEPREIQPLNSLDGFHVIQFGAADDTGHGCCAS